MGGEPMDLQSYNQRKKGLQISICMTLVFPFLLLFQNCSGARFGGEKETVYHANGDGQEGKLSIPLDYSTPQSPSGYQPDISFGLNQIISQNSSMDHIGLYCRTLHSSPQSGLDIIITDPEDTWNLNSESYFTGSSIPANASFTRASSALHWVEGRLVEFSVNQPRYMQNSMGEPSLLLESEATNLLSFSNRFTQASWETQEALADSHRFATDPTGTENSMVIFEEGEGSTAKRISQNRGLSRSTLFTFSVYAKELEAGRSLGLAFFTESGSENRCLFNFTEQTNTQQSGSASTQCGVTPHENGWFRIWISANSESGFSPEVETTLSLELFHNELGYNYIANSHPGILIFGSQLETGNNPSSYIYTEADNETRSADQLRLRQTLNTLRQGNLTLEYEVPMPSSQLSVDLNNGAPLGTRVLMTQNQIEYIHENRRRQNSIFSNNSRQKLNLQISDIGFYGYEDGRSLGSLNGTTNAQIESILITSPLGRSLFLGLSVGSNLVRDEVMSVASKIDSEYDQSHAVLVLGRGNNAPEKVQTQPITLNNLRNGNFEGRLHHFDLVRNSEDEFFFDGSLSDGTFISEQMTCQRP